MKHMENMVNVNVFSEVINFWYEAITMITLTVITIQTCTEDALSVLSPFRVEYHNVCARMSNWIYYWEQQSRSFSLTII